MPTYEYVCEACDHQFELFHSIKEDAKRKCPACGRLKLRRLIGPGAAIVFKGSGFYKTDYRSESYKKAAAADKPPADAKTDAKTDAKSGAKTDTKSDAKTEASSGKKSDANLGKKSAGDAKSKGKRH